MQLTISEYIKGVSTWNLKPQEVFSHYLKKAQSLNPELNAVVRFFDQKVPADIAQLPLAW